jgi:SMODS-associating 2TM, beta-strand rich effector domain
MKEVKPDIGKVTNTTIFLTAAAIIFLLWLYKTPLDTGVIIFCHLTIIITVIKLLFLLFAKVVWRWRIIPQWMRVYLDIPPDLNGHWQGECECKGGTIEFSVEITQDYSNLSYAISTKKDGGKATGSQVNSAVLFVDSNHKYSVITTWYDGGSFKGNKESVDLPKKYRGTSQWEIFSDRNDIPSEIRWDYYTDRCTSGKVIVRRVLSSNEAEKCLEEIEVVGAVN